MGGTHGRLLERGCFSASSPSRGSLPLLAVTFITRPFPPILRCSWQGSQAPSWQTASEMRFQFYKSGLGANGGTPLRCLQWGSLLKCRFLGPAHRDGDSVDMVQGGDRNLCLKNTPLPQIPKGTTIQRETKIRARREGKHRPRNESKLHPRVRLELLASSSVSGGSHQFSGWEQGLELTWSYVAHALEIASFNLPGTATRLGSNQELGI